jgi:hypothetical protein
MVAFAVLNLRFSVQFQKSRAFAGDASLGERPVRLCRPGLAAR